MDAVFKLPRRRTVKKIRFYFSVIFFISAIAGIFLLFAPDDTIANESLWAVSDLLLAVAVLSFVIIIASSILGIFLDYKKRRTRYF